MQYRTRLVQKINIKVCQTNVYSFVNLYHVIIMTYLKILADVDIIKHCLPDEEFANGPIV